MLQDAGLPQGATVAELIDLIRGLYPDPLSLARGRLLADGPPDQVRAQAAGRGVVRLAADGLPVAVLERLPAVEAVQADRGRVTLSTTDPDRTVRALLQQAPHLQGLEVTQTGMEQAFLQLTSEGDAP